ncbi:hypothetical protein MKMG_01850 [Methanogenium sp. MK-MG]|nr:hypothetical protein MKMG_01850 [Methanogenium sp. MK-MG]
MDEFLENGESVKSVAEYLEAVGNITDSLYAKYAFRGQSKISYPINSSAARRLKIFQSDRDEKKRFIKYNNTLISDAILKGYHRKGIIPLEELELLAELQHNGAATCLIDFTYSSLVALYFAVSSTNMNTEDGAVYILNTRDSDKFKHIKSSEITKTISDLLAQIESKLWVWEPSDLNNRIPKQHSVFIFGETEIEKNADKMIKIDKNSKFQILCDLFLSHNIGAETLFNDLTGFSKENSSDKPFYTPEYYYKMENFRKFYFSGNEDDEGCIKLLDDILKSDKYSYNALLIRASLKFNNNDYLGAIEDFDIMIQLRPDDYGSYYSRGLAKLELNNIDGAKEDFATTLKLNPSDESVSDQLEQLNKDFPKNNEDKKSSS